MIELSFNAQHEVCTFSDQLVNRGGNGVHIFSILCAVIYCIASEVFPKVRLLQGVLFGFIAAVIAHGFVLPLLQLAPAVWDAGRDGIISEIVGTAPWAWTIEISRGYLYDKFTRRAADPK